MNATEPSLYDRLGGESAIEAITKALYDRVLADNELKPFFEHTSMVKQVAMQHEFLCAALGGPVTYTGKPLAYIHQGRGIKTLHFAKFVRHLLDTLRDLGVSDEDADAVISRINTHANEITGTSY
jgi:hemoglobin